MEPTRDRIVAAARRLFGEKGFHGTTTAELARTASVAEGTIYRHFKDKKELFVACVEPVIQEAVRRETMLVRTGDSPRETLRRRIVERTRMIRENLAVFDILFTEGKYHPEIAEVLIGQLTASIPEAEWQTMVQAVSSSGLRRPPNPLIMSVGLTAAIWAMVSVGPAADQLFQRWPAPVRFGDLEEELADFVCAALLGPDDQQAPPQTGVNHDA